VAWHSDDRILVAKKGKMDLINFSNGDCVESSISFADCPFTIVPYKDLLILGISLDGPKTEIVVCDKELNIVNSWKVEGTACDFTVVENKVVLSRQLPGNLKVFSLEGESLPDIIWNGTSAGIDGCPPDSVILADGKYGKIYKKQLASGKILWSANVESPFSLCVDRNGVTWVRSNEKNCFTLIDPNGMLTK